MSGLYDASMKRVHRMAKALEQRDAGGDTMKAFTVEWVFVQDMFQQNPCIDRECDLRITIPVVQLAEVDALIAEAEWAMKIVETVARNVSNKRRAQAFLASPLVAAWRERQKGTV